jgi:Tfp pilus assembly protein PilF
MNDLQTLLNTFIIDPENDYNNLSLAKYYHSIGQTASAVSYYTRTAERTER